MLPKALDKLAHDVESEREVSTPLKKALKPTGKAASRAHQLELITRVLDHACKSNSEAADNAGRIALGSLRALVPFLKKKSTSITDTIASVEKYAVNFALSSSSQDEKPSTGSYRETELITSLQQILSSRADAQEKTKEIKRVTRRKNVKREQDKENESPDQSLTDTIFLDNELVNLLFFPHAATMGLQMLLPNQDSVEVATTITGALVIRLTRCCRDLCLSEILALTGKAVLPWLNYVRSFSDEKSQRTFAAYLKRVSCFLFDLCRMPQNDPATILRTRLFALQLESPKLNQFARDILQCVNNFSRGKKQDKSGPAVLETIASVYESALRYVAKYDSSDRRWITEDVSAWLDNVALVWAKQKPEKPIPNIFVLRLSAFRNHASKTSLLDCFELQTDLFRVGAYQLDAKTVARQKTKGLNLELWKKISFFLKSFNFEDLLDSEERTLFLAHSTQFRDDWKGAEDDGLRCLRLLRTLEPVRLFIAATFREFDLPQGAELVLRTYLSALFRGFYVLSWPVLTVYSSGASAIGDIVLRLNKMVGGGLEAARDLIRCYANQRLFASLEDVSFVTAKILQHHTIHSPSASLSWTEWLYNVLGSASKDEFIKLKEIEAEDEMLVSRLSEAMLSSADQMLHFASNARTFSRGYSNILITLRDGLLSYRLYSEAVDVSLQLFKYVTSSVIEDQHRIVAKESARMVAQDMVRLTRDGNNLTFLGKLRIPADKLLSAFVEYSWWARKNRHSFKTHSKYLETADGLVFVRKAVFRFCDLSCLLCPVRRTHERWLAFVHSLSTQKAETREYIWKSVKTKRCSGHHVLGLADQDVVHVSCTASHSQFLEYLRKACEAIVSRSFDRVHEYVSALESMFGKNKELVRHMELILLSVEALEWISTVLAFNSFGTLALRALSLAQECGSLFNVSFSSGETLKACRLLDSLPRPNLNEASEKEVTTTTTLSKGDVRSTSHASLALQEAMSDLKSSLKALWRFKMGSNEHHSHSHSVGGLVVDVGFNMYSSSGQYRLGLVLELVHYLFCLGTVQLCIENLSEARYYTELCSQIACASFPVVNNSFRRIASISRAKCVTKMDALSTVQDSIMKQKPMEEEDLEHGRSISSGFSTLQTVADAMLYVEMARNRESKASSDSDGVRLDFIKALYERCRHILETERHNTILFSDVERSRLGLSLGLTYVLEGDEANALKLIKPLSDRENLYDCEVMVAASYELARLYIRRAGGLRGCYAESLDLLSSHDNLPPRRTRQRRSRRTNFGKSRPPLDETRAAVHQAVHALVPNVSNFAMCRKVWSLAAMVESEPEVAAGRLERAIGLSFNARYEHNTRCKRVTQAGNAYGENKPGDVCGLEKHMQKLSLNAIEELSSQSGTTEITAMMTRERSVLVGVHMDEDKKSIVLWRRCALGFYLRRLWLPSSGSQSYDGIVQRIETILSEMKRSSVREGHKMREDEKLAWWEDRHRLDDKMKLVLSDIQEVWLGRAINLLIPSLLASSERAGQSSEQDFDSYIELGEKACDLSDDGVALGHLVLLVDKPSENIPWESLPLLRDNEISATRTPSMSFLASLWDPEKYFNSRSVFYVLNPDGNLQRTEDRFREKLRSHSAWSGIVGQTSSEVIASAYCGEEIYLYCGHGAGEALFSPSTVCVRTTAPIALLMGCSSCRPRDMEIGDFESNGPAIEFLAHGSPAVVGNLWDVSDGEIDRLTTSMLSLWFGDDDEDLHEETLSLADAVAKSRSKCRLPYLVGAACVVMGVPHIYVRRHPQ